MECPDANTAVILRGVPDVGERKRSSRPVSTRGRGGFTLMGVALQGMATSEPSQKPIPGNRTLAVMDKDEIA